MKRYNNYHKHSHYSSLFGGVGDSNVKQKEYVDRCIELGHTNFFTTEHGCFGDIFEAFDLCKNNNLRCLPGLEGYIVVDNNPELKDKSNYHIMIIPRTDKARKKCNYYNSLAHMNGFYYKPRWSLDYLLQFDKDDLYITSACFDESVDVLTPMGYKNIKSIKAGDYVINKFGEREKINYPTRIKYNGLGYKIQTDSDVEEIICTEDHKFLTTNCNMVTANKEPIWTEAKYLKSKTGSSKSILLYPINVEYNNNDILFKKEYDGYYKKIEHPWSQKVFLKDEIKITPELARFIGFFIGDGYITLKKRPRVGITFNSDEFPFYEQDFIIPVEKQLGITFSRNYRLEHKRVDICTGGIELLNLFYYLFGDCKAETKHIPHRLLHISKDIDMEIMMGMFLSDGSFRYCKKDNYESGRVVYCTISKQLARDFQHLCSVNMIKMTMRQVEKYVDNKGQIHQTAYYVEGCNPIFGNIKKTNNYSHLDVINLFDDIYNDTTQRPFIKYDNKWYKKVKIKTIDTCDLNQDVYCLNNNSHSFIVNGCIVHNCCAGLLKDETSIEKILMPLINHFGDHLLLEVQNHLFDIQKDINKKAIALSESMGLKLCAANDSHYIYPWQTKERHDLMVGKRQLNNSDSYVNKVLPTEGKNQLDIINAEDEFILDFPDYDEFFKRFEKQGILTEQQIESAIDNTLIFDNIEEIQLDYEIKMPNIYPDVPLNDRMKMLEDLVWKKFEEIKIKEHISEEDLPKYIDGINYELQIIKDTNEQIHTCDYFLFNTRNVDLAVNKYNGILTRGGRGSCASFYTNKLLGMTQLDRFKINLPIFPDRFASTARLLDNRALPDIDFNVEAQEPFVKASKELLGNNGCFPMVAYGTMQEGEAFRNVCRSHGLQFDEFNDVAKNLDQYREDKKWKPLIEEAEHYVGTIVSASVHPCAHVLSDKDLLYEYGVARFGDFICVMITSGEADQFKVLKNDYLIVSVWKLIHETFEEIGIPIMDAHDLLDSIKDDERVWNLFSNGITCTLNQVDSDNGMQQAKRYGIKSFEDGALIAAAIRPSFDAWRPKFLNHERYSTGSKDLDKVLEQTQHYILFQENLMQYFDWLGVTPAESIGLIKKISKKKIKPEDFEKLEERLRDNWIKQTGSEKMFNETWEMIQGCMAYGFASPHAAATSLDMCYGAYLKVNYPYEYMTVCLNNYSDDAERTAKLKKELDYFGIKLSNIKFGMSRAKYSYNKEKHLIIKGIGSIKYLNDTVSEQLYTLSQSRVYSHFIDLLIDITEKTSCNSRQLDILVKLDYFSDFGEANQLTYIIDKFSKLYDKKTGFKKSIKQSKLGLDPEFVMPYCEEYKAEEVKEVNLDAIATAIPREKQQEFKDILGQCERHKKTGEFNGYNYEKFFKISEMPDDMKLKYATKISEAEYSGVDSYKLLTNLKYNGTMMTIKEKIKAQQEYLSYIDYINPNIDIHYIVVTNLDTTYSPKFIAYCLKNGQTCQMKVRKSKGSHDFAVNATYKSKPFENGDILMMIKAKQEPKAKYIDGEWKRDYDDKEWWLYDYETCNTISDMI